MFQGLIIGDVSEIPFYVTALEATLRVLGHLGFDCLPPTYLLVSTNSNLLPTLLYIVIVQ